MVKKSSHTEHIEEELDNEERYGLFTTQLHHQNLEIIDMKIANGIAIEKGINFDSKVNN